MSVTETQLERCRATDFVADVAGMVEAGIREATAALPLSPELAQLAPGKLLRTRLAARLVECGAVYTDTRALKSACTAVEISHTASLCHDDVIDSGVLRRAGPTLWTLTSPSAAVLIGDLLLCKAMEVLVGAARGRYVDPFLCKVREVCAAEAEQELVLRGRRVGPDTCLRLAREKTGPFFAFVGSVSAGDEEALSGALEEAGYLIGTAYQLFDDLVDVAGDEKKAKKTLGTDLARGKFTLPQRPGNGHREAVERVRSLCRRAVGQLDGWPRAQAGIEAYIERDLEPVIKRNVGRPCLGPAPFDAGDAAGRPPCASGGRQAVERQA